MGDDGQVYVRVALSRSDRDLLARVAAEECERLPPDVVPMPDIRAELAAAAASPGTLDLRVVTFWQVDSLVFTANMRHILREPGATDVSAFSDAFSLAGARTAHPCARRRSDPAAPPRPLHCEPMQFPTESELLECGWSDAEQFRSRYAGRRVNRYDADDLAALEYVHLHGNCAPFAVAVHDETDWQIVGLRMPWERVVSHVACRTPDGAYVDARGDDLTAEEVEMTREQALRAFLRSPVAHAEAREGVRLLLPELRAEARPAP